MYLGHDACEDIVTPYKDLSAPPVRIFRATRGLPKLPPVCHPRKNGEKQETWKNGKTRKNRKNGENGGTYEKIYQLQCKNLKARAGRRMPKTKKGG